VLSAPLARRNSLGRSVPGLPAFTAACACASSSGVISNLERRGLACRLQIVG
jgi:hypothetical protein